MRQQREHLPAAGFDEKAEGWWGGSGVTAQAYVLRYKSVTIVHRRFEMSDELVQHQACSNKERVLKATVFSASQPRRALSQHGPKDHM
jgi:hypothetical protein